MTILLFTNIQVISITFVRYASAFHFLSAAITLKPKHGQLFMLLASKWLGFYQFSVNLP